MKSNIIGKPLSQLVIESQNELGHKKQNIREMHSQYNIKKAYLRGDSKDIYKDNIRSGYLQIQESYENLEDALNNFKLGHTLVIEEGKYSVGIVYNTIEECDKTKSIYNIYSEREVHNPNNAIKACDLDNIRTPQALMSLYEEVSKDHEELKDILEHIDNETISNPFMDARELTESLWNQVHEKLNLVITDKSYTSFTI